MADEEKETKEGEAAGEKKGSAIKAMLVPVLASAVTSAIVGIVMIMLFSPKPAADGEEGESGEHAPAGEEAAGGGHGGGHGSAAGEKKSGGHGAKSEGPSQAGVYHQYDPFIVTIFDHEKVHYLKATVALELKSEDVKAEIQAKDAQIRDSLIFVLGDFTLRELLDNQAKLLVKDVLVKTLNKIVGKEKVLNVYFTEFTIQ